MVRAVEMRNVGMVLGALSLAGALVFGCSCDDKAEVAAGNGGAGPGAGAGGAVQCLPGLESITLDPADSTVVIDGSAPPPITFTATGVFSGGTTQVIDATSLAWSVSRNDDTPPGEIEAGVLQPYASAGGVVTVEATDGCVAGSTTVTLYLEVTIGEPNDPSQWESEPITGEPSAELVYPSNETRFPRNVYRQLFQWHTADFTEFRLVFEGPYALVTVYTDGAFTLCEGKNPAAGCWEADETAWSYIAGSNAGETAEWVVDALDLSGASAVIRRSDTTVIGFSREDVKGAIFYWSTTSAGVRRGKLSQLEPEDYIVGKPVGTSYSSPDDQVGCVACHTVSRDGRYLLAPVSAQSGNSLWIMEVTSAAPPAPLVKEVENTGGHGFATISPDNVHVVVSFKDGMWMVDRATGEFEADLPTAAWEGTQPDWSPDGTQLVFASGKGDAPGGSSLVLIPWTGSAWGQPDELLAPLNDTSNLFPMFDPLGEWIAFANGEGGHGDETAQLWMIAATGGTPIELENANQITSNQVTDGQYQNSQPTWAPPGDLDWIAFNTKREYGVVLEEGTQQIWVAAIDRSKAAAGDDPSYPAFRVPFQGLEENNHRAFWTLDVNEEGSGGSGAGGGPPCPDDIPVYEPCDPLADCCADNTYCDSQDGGKTYVCVPVVPE
jgi:hypothetical protein